MCLCCFYSIIILYKVVLKFFQRIREIMGRCFSLFLSRKRIDEKDDIESNKKHKKQNKDIRFNQPTKSSNKHNVKKSANSPTSQFQGHDISDEEMAHFFHPSAGSSKINSEEHMSRDKLKVIKEKNSSQGQPGNKLLKSNSSDHSIRAAPILHRATNNRRQEPSSTHKKGSFDHRNVQQYGQKPIPSKENILPSKRYADATEVPQTKENYTNNSGQRHHIQNLKRQPHYNLSPAITTEHTPLHKSNSEIQHRNDAVPDTTLVKVTIVEKEIPEYTLQSPSKVYNVQYKNIKTSNQRHTSKSGDISFLETSFDTSVPTKISQIIPPPQRNNNYTPIKPYTGKLTSQDALQHEFGSSMKTNSTAEFSRIQSTNATIAKINNKTYLADSKVVKPPRSQTDIRYSDLKDDFTQNSPNTTTIDYQYSTEALPEPRKVKRKPLIPSTNIAHSTITTPIKKESCEPVVSLNYRNRTAVTENVDLDEHAKRFIDFEGKPMGMQSKKHMIGETTIDLDYLINMQTERFSQDNKRLPGNINTDGRHDQNNISSSSLYKYKPSSQPIIGSAQKLNTVSENTRRIYPNVETTFANENGTTDNDQPSDLLKDQSLKDQSDAPGYKTYGQTDLKPLVKKVDNILNCYPLTQPLIEKENSVSENEGQIEQNERVPILANKSDVAYCQLNTNKNDVHDSDLLKDESLEQESKATDETVSLSENRFIKSHITDNINANPNYYPSFREEETTFFPRDVQTLTHDTQEQIISSYQKDHSLLDSEDQIKENERESGSFNKNYTTYGQFDTNKDNGNDSDSLRDETLKQELHTVDEIIFTSENNFKEEHIFFNTNVNMSTQPNIELTQKLHFSTNEGSTAENVETQSILMNENDTTDFPFYPNKNNVRNVDILESLCLEQRFSATTNVDHVNFVELALNTELKNKREMPVPNLDNNNLFSDRRVKMDEAVNDTTKNTDQNVDLFENPSLQHESNRAANADSKTNIIKLEEMHMADDESILTINTIVPELKNKTEKPASYPDKNYLFPVNIELSSKQEPEKPLNDDQTSRRAAENITTGGKNPIVKFILNTTYASELESENETDNPRQDTNDVFSYQADINKETFIKKSNLSNSNYGEELNHDDIQKSKDEGEQTCTASIKKTFEFELGSNISEAQIKNVSFEVDCSKDLSYGKTNETEVTVDNDIDKKISYFAEKKYFRSLSQEQSNVPTNVVQNQKFISLQETPNHRDEVYIQTPKAENSVAEKTFALTPTKGEVSFLSNMSYASELENKYETDNPSQDTNDVFSDQADINKETSIKESNLSNSNYGQESNHDNIQKSQDKEEQTCTTSIKKTFEFQLDSNISEPQTKNVSFEGDCSKDLSYDKKNETEVTTDNNIDKKISYFAEKNYFRSLSQEQSNVPTKVVQNQKFISLQEIPNHKDEVYIQTPEAENSVAKESFALTPNKGEVSFLSNMSYASELENKYETDNPSQDMNDVFSDQANIDKEMSIKESNLTSSNCGQESNNDNIQKSQDEEEQTSIKKTFEFQLDSNISEAHTKNVTSEADCNQQLSYDEKSENEVTTDNDIDTKRSYFAEKDNFRSLSQQQSNVPTNVVQNQKFLSFQETPNQRDEVYIPTPEAENLVAKETFALTPTKDEVSKNQTYQRSFIQNDGNSNYFDSPTPLRSEDLQISKHNSDNNAGEGNSITDSNTYVGAIQANNSEEHTSLTDKEAVELPIPENHIYNSSPIKTQEDDLNTSSRTIQSGTFQMHPSTSGSSDGNSELQIYREKHVRNDHENQPSKKLKLGDVDMVELENHKRNIDLNGENHNIKNVEVTRDNKEMVQIQNKTRDSLQEDFGDNFVKIANTSLNIETSMETEGNFNIQKFQAIEDKAVEAHLESENNKEIVSERNKDKLEERKDAANLTTNEQQNAKSSTVDTDTQIYEPEDEINPEIYKSVTRLLEQIRQQAVPFENEIENFTELEDSNKYYYIEESLRRLIDKLDDLFDDIGENKVLRNERKKVYKFIFPLFDRLDEKVEENRERIQKERN